MTQALLVPPFKSGREIETVACPQCHQPAIVEWRALIDGVDGPVDHTKIKCADRHWFMLPTNLLSRSAD